MSLAETQRRLWRLVTAPAGVADALRNEVGAPALDTLVCSNAAADASTRLDVYASAYFYRIHGVLADDFPALAAALGDDAFNDLVTSYLLVYPPTHPSLRYAGNAVADFLAAHDAAAGLRERAPWAADLARLEWALVDAFDAVDSERLTREFVASLPAEGFAALELALRPGASHLALAWPVDEMRVAFDDEAPVEAPAQLDSNDVIVWRSAERVRFRRAQADELNVLPRLQQGATFAQLCEELAREYDDAETPALAAGLLERWLADGVLRGTLELVPGALEE